jgi:hypothetical protein
LNAIADDDDGFFVMSGIFIFILFAYAKQTKFKNSFEKVQSIFTVCVQKEKSWNKKNNKKFNCGKAHEFGFLNEGAWRGFSGISDGNDDIGCGWQVVLLKIVEDLENE